MAGRQIVRPRQELHPNLLYVGRMGSDEFRAARILGTVRCWWHDGAYPPERIPGAICAARSHFCEGKVVWAQSCNNGGQAHQIDGWEVGFAAGLADVA